MACYIHTHPRHIELQKYFNVPPLTIDLLIAEFQKQTGSDKYPNVENILTSYNHQDKVVMMSRDAFKKEQIKYNNNPIVTLVPYDTGVSGPQSMRVEYKKKVTLPDIRGFEKEYKEAQKKINQDIKDGTIVEDGEVKVAYQKSKVKDGVSEVFKSNPELADIGTQEQYSAYLDTIFPDSNVKDIVYHGTNILLNLKDKLSFWTSNRESAFFAARKHTKYDATTKELVYSAILNIKNPLITSNENFNYKKGTDFKGKDGVITQKDTDFTWGGFNHSQFAVNKKEQIHILGSKQDIEGFKEFVINNTASPKNSIPDSELDTRVTLFLNKLGIKVNSLDGIRNGEGNLIADVVARAKFTKKNLAIIIDIVENKRGIDTLSEEAAHTLVWMLRGTPLYNSMMQDIIKMPVYQQVLDEYANNYTTDLEFKEEAIVKQITASIVRQAKEGTDLTEKQYREATEHIGRMSRWLGRVINWLKELLNSYKTSSFDYAAMKLLFADTQDLDISKIANDIEAYQKDEDKEAALTKQVKFLADKVKQAGIIKSKGVDKDGKEINKYQQGEHVYKESVTHYTRKDKELTRTALQRKQDEVNRLYGETGHAQLNNALLRAIEKKKYGDSTTAQMLDALIEAKDRRAIELFAEELIAPYPDNAEFLLEQPIGDKVTDRAGTPDFSVIYHENGKIHFDTLDWKFTEFKKQDGKVIYDEMYKKKKEEYLEQLKEYRRIYADAYGIKFEGKTRLAPIALTVKTIFEDNKPVDWKVTGIEMTDLGYSENKKYTNQIPLETEKTGISTIDSIIEGLIIERNRIEDKKEVEDENKVLKQNRLKAINDTIKHLILTRDIDKFLNTAISELTRMNNESDLSRLSKLSSSFDFYKGINFAGYKDSITEDNYNKVKEKIGIFRDLLDKGKLVFTDKINSEVKEIANNENILAFDEPQKDMGIWTKLLSSFSTQQHPKIKALYKLVMRSKNKTKTAIDEFNAKIKDALDGVNEYAKNNGIKTSEIFNFMVKHDAYGNLKLIGKYDKELYDKIKEARENKNYKYLQSVYTFNKEAYIKAAESNEKYWKEYYKFEKDEAAFKKLLKEKVDLFEKRYNAEKYPYVLANKEDRYLKIADSVPTSEAYNKIQNNKRLKEFYNLFHDFTQKSRKELGMEYDGTFVPQMMQSLIEEVNNTGLGAIEGMGNRFWNASSAKYQGNYGEVNVVTGEVEHKIPMPYTEKIGEKASTDLGKVLSLWALAYYNNVHMQEVETSANLLYEALKNEKFFVTDLAGNVKTKDNGDPILKNAESSHTLKAFEDFMNEAIYGVTVKGDKAFSVKRKRIQRNADGSIVKDKEGKPIMEEYDFDVSTYKFVSNILSYISKKALGLNMVSAGANLFGGMTNGIIEGAKGQFYSKSQFIKGVTAFSSGKLNPEILTAVKYFDIMGDMEGFNRANALSVNEAEKFFTYDKLFVLQKGGDSLVNNSILLAMLQSHGLDSEGKIKNLKTLPKETKSIYQSMKIVDGNLTIAGLTDSADNKEFVKFRQKVLEVGKTVMGISPTYDIRLINQTIWGRAIMQFRNWMPRMAEARFGGIRYNENLEALEQGRYTTFKNFIQGSILTNTAEALKIMVGVGSNVDEILTNKFNALPNSKREQIVKSFGGDISNSADIEKARIAYIELNKSNLKATMMELQVLLSVWLCLMLMGGGAGDDDDKTKTGFKRLTAKIGGRFYNEISFFVNPASFNAIMKSPFAATSTLADIANYGTHAFGQGKGVLLGDTKIQDKYKPLKYLGKMFPLTSEGVRDITLFAGEDYWK
jgi:hypothetical protein